MVRRHSPRWGRSIPRSIFLLAGLLTYTASPPACAVTTISVDAHPDPVTLTVGETVTIRFDLAKAGGSGNRSWARDLTGAGQYDPTAPISAPASGAITDGGGGDSDPAPARLAWSFTIPPGMPAGRYVFRVQDTTDNSGVTFPLTVAPRPDAQTVSGQVLLGSGSTAPGSPPAEAIVWAYSDLNTPVASANIRADGSYTLPVPPGSYLLFAEWLGNLRSQRQVVTVTAGQQAGSVDHTLLVGQEVSGSLRDDAGKPIANAPVVATPASASPISTQTLADGSYLLVLPEGQWRISARGMEKAVRVADQPLDGVDFPAPSAGPTPAAGTILTVAGNGLGALGGEGGPAAAARLDNPTGLAMDRTGNLYIAQNFLGRIQKVDDMTGLLTTVAGSGTVDLIRGLIPSGDAGGGSSGDGGPATRAQLWIPQHVAVDGAGNLYLSEVRSHRVRRVDAQTGIITTVAGSGAMGSGKGSYSGDGGPATAATLNGPQALVFDRAGNLYIADNLNARVRKVSPAGIITTVAGGGKEPVTDGANALTVTLGRPRNLAIDGQGDLLIWDGGLNRVLRLHPDGKLSFYAGNGTAGFSGDGGPATAAQLNAGVLYMVVDSAGNLFLSDQNNNRVRKVSPDGTITTVAGSGPTGPGSDGFSGDGGPARDARLSAPQGMAVDAAGNLYISDTLNKRIRKVIGIAAPGLVAGQ
jgi:hypothetical protein